MPKLNFFNNMSLNLTCFGKPADKAPNRALLLLVPRTTAAREMLPCGSGGDLKRRLVVRSNGAGISLAYLLRGRPRRTACAFLWLWSRSLSRCLV
jgi:hypothetical protein